MRAHHRRFLGCVSIFIRNYTLFSRQEILHSQALSFLENRQVGSGFVEEHRGDRSPFAYVDLLRTCNELEAGRRAHAEIRSNGLELDPVVGPQLVQMYLRCGGLADAEDVFQRLRWRGVVLWTLMITNYHDSGNSKLALQLFCEMQLEGIKPDRVAFLAVLNVLDSPKFLAQARHLHQLFISCGMESDIVLANALICVYGKCLSSNDAGEIFWRVKEPDIVSWNSIVGAYCQVREMSSARHMFRLMQLQGINPGRVTCVSVLNACDSPPRLSDGRAVHACAMEGGFDNELIVANALLHMYAKCGSPADCQLLFDQLQKRDIVSWTAIISAYALKALHEQAYDTFRKMQLEGVRADKVTLVTLLDACTRPEALDYGKAVHDRARESGLESVLMVANAVINMYGKCGSVGEARMMFDSMVHRDVISWNTIIGTYAQHGLWRESVEVFSLMETVKPDSVTLVTVLNSIANLQDVDAGRWAAGIVQKEGLETDTVVGTSLVNMHGKCGSIAEARDLFDRIAEKRLLLWNCMLSAYVQHKQNKEAVKLFREMDFPPDRITIITVLNACAAVASLREGKLVHRKALDAQLEGDVYVATALIDMYAKCGALHRALEVFEKMPEPNTVSWNTMIAASAQHGKCIEAVTLFRKMLQVDVTVDSVTLINALCACSHGGLIEEASQYFISMSTDFQMQPGIEHYGCMVDLLGRLGWLEEAEKLISRMPLPPNSVIQATILAACRMHGDVKRAKRVAEQVLKMDPESPSSYVVMSNVYAENGEFEEAGKLRKMRLEKGVRRKEPGISWIEIDGQVHEFVAGDTNHPRWREIYAEVERMNRLMRAAGYVPDTTPVSHDIDEEEKSSVICYHSERLAVAFAVLSCQALAGEDEIRVFKNIRVCRDCHTALKFMSRIVQREVVVRDAHRFHHFVDGSCSCGDFW